MGRMTNEDDGANSHREVSKRCEGRIVQVGNRFGRRRALSKTLDMGGLHEVDALRASTGAGGRRVAACKTKNEMCETRPCHCAPGHRKITTDAINHSATV